MSFGNATATGYWCVIRTLHSRSRRAAVMSSSRAPPLCADASLPVADIAEFAVSQLQNDKYLYKTVVLSNLTCPNS